MNNSANSSQRALFELSLRIQVDSLTLRSAKIAGWVAAAVILIARLVEHFAKAV